MNQGPRVEGVTENLHCGCLSIPAPPGDLLQAVVPHSAVLGDGHRGSGHPLVAPCGTWGDWVDDRGGAGRGRGCLDCGNKWKEQEATALGSVADPM